MNEGLVVDSLGGQCPVQGSGTIDGQVWYFRARGTRWSFEVWRAGVDMGAHGDLPDEDAEWFLQRRWGAADDEFAAGYMPDDVAMSFILEAAALWRQWVAAGRP